MPALRLVLAALVASVIFSSQALAGPITLTPGTALGVESDGNRIIQYDSTGNVIETLAIAGRTYTGIAQVGSDLYVASFDAIYSVDLGTGALTFEFNLASANENLGRRGANLIGLNWGSGVHNEYTTAGALVNTLTLAAGATGYDSNGTNFYAGQYSGSDVGGIRVYDSSGAFTGAIALGLPGGSISGLAYDPGADQFWVATGFGDDRIRIYDGAGTLQNSFATPGWINGLTVVSSAAVPEPGSIALLGLGLTGFVVFRRRSRSRA